MQAVRLPKYTKTFWYSYLIFITWAISVVVSSYILFRSSEDFPDFGSTGAFLSFSLLIRRAICIFFIATSISFMIFFKFKKLDKALIFVAAWMWAAYIDDHLVMYRYIYISDNFFSQALITIRPLVVILLSWMAFESYVRQRIA